MTYLALIFTAVGTSAAVVARRAFDREQLQSGVWAFAQQDTVGEVFEGGASLQGSTLFDGVECCRAYVQRTQHVGYYPYGLPHRQADGQPRLYESQELQTALNLNQYRYLARALRPDLGLRTTPDPLAPKYPHLSPYTYCASSPTIFTDPTGTDLSVLSYDGHLEYSIENKDMDCLN